MSVPCTILEVFRTLGYKIRLDSPFRSDWETRFYFYFIRLWAKRDPSSALKSGTIRDVIFVKLLFGDLFENLSEHLTREVK
jgi:hypothetical protein